MSWIENLLIITGISMDVFALMECQGSLVAKVRLRQLAGLCAAVAAVQFAALLVGWLLVRGYFASSLPDDGQILGQILALLIFVGIGIHLAVKAVRNERVIERREEGISIRPALRKLVISTMYAFLAGIAFGFFSTGMVALLVMIAAASVLFIVAGIYTGYHFGFEQKQKAYIVGAVLLLAAGADVLVRLFHVI